LTVSDTEFTTEPVPEERTVPWWRVGVISAMVAFSLPTFITGLEISRVLPGRQVPVALVGGSVLLAFIASVCGSIGARTRLSSYMLVRVAFGTRGAALVNVAFALSLLGWFGVNIDLFSGAVLRLAAESFNATLPVWLIELAAGTVMTVTTIYGFRAINTLSLVLVPVLMVVTAVLIARALDVMPLQEILATGVPASFTLGDSMSSVVGGVIVGAVIMPDVTRFIRHWRGAIYTAVLAYLVVGVIVMSAGAMAGIALEGGELLEIMLLIGLGWGAFAIVIAGSWVLNSLNLYSTMLSVEATWPGLDNRLLVLTLGALGTVAAFLNILDVFLTFLFYLAIVFVPVAGVITVDYLVTRRRAYHADRLALEAEVRPLAVGAWMVGAAVALAGANGVVALSGVAALDAMLVAALAYGVFSRMAGHA
jgi:cytosine permease